jgi:hypothetical protein
MNLLLSQWNLPSPAEFQRGIMVATRKPINSVQKHHFRYEFKYKYTITVSVSIYHCVI